MLRICKTLLAMSLVIILPMASSSVTAQTNETATPIPQETLDAAVNMLFQQTADANTHQTATAGAAPYETATAQALIAPTQTLEALFQQAMTATAETLVPSYGDYGVVNIQELNLLAGPAQTAVHLAPNGTRFLHVAGPRFCFYDLSNSGEWAQTVCQEFERDSTGRDAEELRWSPDSRWLSMPTYREALMFLSDADIRVLNSDTFEITSLTEDNSEDSLTDDSYNGNFDLTASWQNDSSLFFLRYRPNTDGDALIPFASPHLTQIDVPDGTAQELALLPSAVPLEIYVLAASRDGQQIAYAVDTQSREPRQGVWLMDLDDLQPRQIGEIEDLNDIPINLDYSANDRYLMIINRAGSSLEPTSVIRIIELDTNELIDVDSEQVVIGAAWSPRGNGLAYLVRDLENPENAGLYITDQPGQPGRLVLQGNYAPTTCCWRMPMEWASNDIIALGRGGEEGVLLVTLGD